MVEACVLQFYDGTKNDLVSTLLSKPTINEVNASSIATVTENNSLPTGYNVRYTFGEGSATPEDPTATSPKNGCWWLYCQECRNIESGDRAIWRGADGSRL